MASALCATCGHSEANHTPTCRCNRVGGMASGVTCPCWRYVPPATVAPCEACVEFTRTFGFTVAGLIYAAKNPPVVARDGSRVSVAGQNNAPDHELAPSGSLSEAVERARGGKPSVKRKGYA